MLNRWPGLRMLITKLHDAMDGWRGRARRRRGRPAQRRLALGFETLEGRTLPATSGLLGGGVLSQFTTGLVQFAPQYTHLGGGGASEWAYDGKSGGVSLTALLKSPGVLANFSAGNAIF